LLDGSFLAIIFNIDRPYNPYVAYLSFCGKQKKKGPKRSSRWGLTYFGKCCSWSGAGRFDPRQNISEKPARIAGHVQRLWEVWPRSAQACERCTADVQMLTNVAQSDNQLLFRDRGSALFGAHRWWRWCPMFAGLGRSFVRARQWCWYPSHRFLQCMKTKKAATLFGWRPSHRAHCHKPPVMSNQVRSIPTYSHVCNRARSSLENASVGIIIFFAFFKLISNSKLLVLMCKIVLL
jgi:hypothetical protein